MVPTVRFPEVSAPALVLGSTQPLGMINAESGVEIARRSSGGGAVLLWPGEVLWVDLLVPARDDLWDDDVGRSSHWLGETWTLALADLGVGSEWHDGPLVTGPWSQLACFGGLGPGEVTVGGRKVVGISQRRSRAGALFQCAALLAWDPGALVALLALDAGAREQAVKELSARASPLALEKAALEEAFLQRLADC